MRWHGHLASGIFRAQAEWLVLPRGPDSVRRFSPGRPSHSRSMNPWLPFCLAILLLSIPGFPRGSSRAGRDVDPMPEMPGLLGVLHRFFRLYCGLWHQLRTDRWAPLPETGPAILISNHTCGIDHMLLQSSSRRLLGFMVAREYYECAMAALDLLVHRLHPGQSRRPRPGGDPGGRCGRWGKAASCRSSRRARSYRPRAVGSARLKPGTAYIAIRAGVPVVPAYIIGTPPTDEIFRSLATPSRARVYLRRADRPLGHRAGSGRRQGRAVRGHRALPVGPAGAPGAGVRGRGRR